LLRWAILLAASLVSPAATGAQTASPPLTLEAKLPLGPVSGRIDHLGIDLKRKRLLIAELGNNSLGVVDLSAGKVLSRIAGLAEPQGVAYVPPSDSVFVTNADDGSVRVLRGEDLTAIGRIELGDDADNVRLDAPRKQVLVGYGKGALAVIDPVSLSKTADVRLKAHPEGFQIDETGTRVFVNVPDAREIVVVDLATGSTQSLPTREEASNFPMAIDGEAHRILVVFRSPPSLTALSSQDGHVAAKVDTCGDADDSSIASATVST
jgi:DNA-binding beta-propeller fold protein YncE